MGMRNMCFTACEGGAQSAWHNRVLLRLIVSTVPPLNGDYHLHSATRCCPGRDRCGSCVVVVADLPLVLLGWAIYVPHMRLCVCQHQLLIPCLCSGTLDFRSTSARSTRPWQAWPIQVWGEGHHNSHHGATYGLWLWAMGQLPAVAAASSIWQRAQLL